MSNPIWQGKKVEGDKALFIGDLHHPFQDDVAVGLSLQFCRWYQPDVVFLIGDIIDFYQLSRFDKNPERVNQLQSDIDLTVAFLQQLVKSAPRATIHYLAGNHEQRITTWKWKNPAVNSLRSFTLGELLSLHQLGIIEHSYHDCVEWHGMIVEHGCRVRSKSAYTAAAMLELRGRSGISGHSHRLGVSYRTDHSGVKAWYENGALCRLDPEYCIGLPDWQQGFTVGSARSGDDRFALTQVPIIRGRLYYGDRVWE